MPVVTLVRLIPGAFWATVVEDSASFRVLMLSVWTQLQPAQ